MADVESKSDRRGYLKAYREANREKALAYAVAYYAAHKEESRIAGAARYAAKADEYKARARKWELENPDRRRELGRDNYARHREAYLETGRRDYAANPEKHAARKAIYHAKFPEKGAALCRLRQTRKANATPAWANLEAIKVLYEQAARLKKETGLAWHVDHEIPLKHPLVCGLHNEFNLRVIPARLNQSKGNRFEVV